MQDLPRASSRIGTGLPLPGCVGWSPRSCGGSSRSGGGSTAMPMTGRRRLLFLLGRCGRQRRRVCLPLLARTSRGRPQVLPSLIGGGRRRVRVRVGWLLSLLMMILLLLLVRPFLDGSAGTSDGRTKVIGHGSSRRRGDPLRRREAVPDGRERRWTRVQVRRGHGDGADARLAGAS